MTSMRPPRRSAAFAVAVVLGLLVPPTASASGPVAPGIDHRPFTVTTGHGAVNGHLLTVDLHRARLGLLHPGSIAARDEVPDMANARGAVAGVNGDFFNISSVHEGVEPTGSSVGPEIAGGRDRKGAVPAGQRFGPGLPTGTSTWDVFGVGVDRRARVGGLDLTGYARTSEGTFDLEGLNQYALAEDGIGVFTSEWGPMSRVRSTCGSDASRETPCSAETEEVVVRDGVVVAEHEEPGAGAIPRGTTVLVGREDGAAELESLDPGDRVRVRPRLVAEDAPPFRFAVGGFPILRDGAPLAGLDAGELAPRTAAGASADGRFAYLVVVDGRSAVSAGMTVAELADLLRSFGADDAVNLDGGGSSTFALRGPGEDAATVRNVPSDGKPRPVANGIGVFPR
ncbi:phosphodiester glycosidase family protein [Saccharopolyspora cebuensis]|uniref:Phosphodiester glycosidase family protein n=1 Tax=Saccharopolyspora cebuensis TaxID=418759 RepID=A0ABV4CIX0_9PSEU